MPWPRHHHRAHWRHVGHQLHVQLQFPHRRAGIRTTLPGDGLATIVASRWRAGQHHLRREHRRVALTRARSARGAHRRIAILLSFCPGSRRSSPVKRPASSAARRWCWYGMISAVGIRNLVENHVDFMLEPQRADHGAHLGARSASPTARPAPSLLKWAV